MVLSRGMALSLLITLLVCSMLVRITNAECGGGHHGDDNQRCLEEDGFDPDDDIDDTYKVVNKMVIPPPTFTVQAQAAAAATGTGEDEESGHYQELEQDLEVIETETIVLGH